MDQKKIKIAVLDLTCCTGCEANLLGVHASITDYMQDFEITHWRMLKDEEPSDFDVALVEGYACNEEQVELLKQARETSAVLVAFGTCAVSGNIFSQLKPENYEKINAQVYGQGHRAVTKFVKPVSHVVKVDRVIRGCPANVDAVRKLLSDLSEHPVSSKDIKVSEPDYVARIEGHARLSVNFEEKTAHFFPEEGERYVEALVVGRPYLNAPKVHSRICGICPVAHSLCSIKAIEQALDVPMPDVAERLRRIFQCGQMVQSHLLHLYFMILPSMMGLGSSMEINQRYPEEMELVRGVKSAAEDIFFLIGGAPLHPVSLTVGGFTKVPPPERLAGLKKKILDILENAEKLVALFTSYDSWPEVVTSSHMMCINPEDDDISYPMWGSRIHFDGPESFDADRYRDFIAEEILPDHPAKIGFLMPDKPVKTGAVARLSRYFDRLNPHARKAFSRSGVNFGNPFHNNTAQAVELLQYLEEAALLLGSLEGRNLDEALVDRHAVREKALSQEGNWPRRGVSAIEAPRGVLLHEVRVDKDGCIFYYNIIPPTNLNLSGLDEDIALLLAAYSGESDRRRIELIEDLIRAMDPCITCAVH